MFHLIIGFIYFVVGGVPLGRGPSSLGSLSGYPWVVVGVSLGTSCLLLACFLLAPLLAETQECVSTGWRLLSLSVCLLACRDAVRHVSTGRWLFRVSRLGRYIGWAAFLGRLVMVFFGGDGHSSSQGKSPGAAHMSAPGCFGFVCMSICVRLLITKSRFGCA